MCWTIGFEKGLYPQALEDFYQTSGAVCRVVDLLFVILQLKVKHEKATNRYDFQQMMEDCLNKVFSW